MTQVENTQAQTRNIDALIEKVNEILFSQEPENISVDTYGGYTGYKPQYVKNAMNKVFGVDGWGYEEISSEIRPTKTRDGETLMVIARVEITIEGVKRHPKAWGQSMVTKGAIGDAQKGASTDAMKKALSDFSIGSRAFEGKLSKEDAEEWKRQQEAAAKRKQEEAREEERKARQEQERNARAAASNGNARPQERNANPPAAAEARASRPAQAANAPARPAQASAHREPAPAKQPAPAAAPAPAQPVEDAPAQVATMNTLVKAYTKINLLDAKGKVIMWTTFMHDVLREEIASGEITMPALLNSGSEPAAKFRVKLTDAIMKLKEDAKKAARS